MAATTNARETRSLRLITHNIRFAIKTPAPGEEPWTKRRSRLCAQLGFLTAGHDSAFVLLQEVLHGQLQDIAASLGPLWAHAGLGRDDGWTAGEYSPIFYPQATWWCERSQTYWLSETPEEPGSRGWDAVLPRVATFGRFRHKASGAKVVVVSTHLDHRGQVARVESAKLLRRLAAEWAAGSEDDAPDHNGAAIADGASAAPTLLPVLLGGDFNSTPEGGAYQTITAPGEGKMVDISGLVPEAKRYGNGEITYTSFGEPNETPARIDFLFARHPTATIRFASFGILPNRFDDGVFLSDHRAVVADVEIPVAIS